VNLIRALPGRRAGGEEDARRSRRVAEVLQLVEQFVYDLGLLIAGRAVDLDGYVEAAVATRLRAALAPARTSRGVMHPDFGEYAQVRIEGNLLDLSRAVRAVVEFDDRSTWSDRDGGVVRRSRRRVRLCLTLDPAVTTVLDHLVEIV
jgi:hypothetical protein